MLPLEDGAIVLKPGVAACFAAQLPAVASFRPCRRCGIRGQSLVKQNQENSGSDPMQGGDVAEFLFGADRGALVRLAGSLMEIQRGACFYCDGRISTAGHVDHLVPWVRYQRRMLRS